MKKKMNKIIIKQIKPPNINIDSVGIMPIFNENGAIIGKVVKARNASLSKGDIEFEAIIADGQEWDLIKDSENKITGISMNGEKI